jgi:hypothetical protein
MRRHDRLHGLAVSAGALLVASAALVCLVGVPSASASATGPALVASTTSLDFGLATLGTYVGPEDVTLYNSSSSSVRVTGFGFSGDDDFLFDNAQDQCDQVLPAKTTCLLAFDFLPGALGNRSATVTVFDTALSGLTISMTGLGSIGYYQVNAQGAVGYAGDAAYYGDLSGTSLNKPIIGIAPTGDDGGYWLAASDGGVFNYGSAAFYGSAGALHLNKPIVGIAADSARGANGYWMVASDGGIFSYGGAQFYGSTGGMHLNQPIVGMATTLDGGGYWLVASDGGIFAYGDARFYGSTGGMHLNQPIVGMAPTPDNAGYWLVAADGGIFAFGDAQFYGSAGGMHLNQPIVDMAAMPDGGGYWFSAADGGLFNYGTAPFYGSGVGAGFGQVVGMATDGVPTAQAATDAPALRHLAPGTPPRGLPPGTPRFAGPGTLAAG